MLEEIWWLLVAYQVKHFLCDYPLQTEYMLGKFKPGSNFIAPLAGHCGVHVIGTFVISSTYFYHKDILRINEVIAVCLFDFIVHFVMDRIKAGPQWLGRYKSLSAGEFMTLIAKEKNGPTAETVKARRNNKFFWWSLGLDQQVHHLTHYCIIFYLLHVIGY